MPMENMPVGTIIHNVEMKPAKGPIARRWHLRAAYRQDSGYAQLRLTSGELRMVPRRWSGVQPRQPKH